MRIPPGTRELVHERSGGMCERCLVRPAAQIHHRCASQAGGSRNTPWINLASNLVDLCGTSADGCHGFATLYPALARRTGWVVPRGVADQLGGCGPVAIEDEFQRSWWLHPDGRKIRLSAFVVPEGLV